MMDVAVSGSYEPDLQSAAQRGQHKLRQMMRTSRHSLPAGRSIPSPGRLNNRIYQLVDGWAAQVRTLDDGLRQLVLIYLPDEFMALDSLFLGSSTDPILTVSASVIGWVDRKYLDRAMTEDPDVAIFCLSQVAEHNRRLRNSVVAMGRGSAEQRMAALLIDFQQRLAAAGKIKTNAHSFPVPLTQAELADCLGLTPVHVNRVIRSLREQRIVEIHNRQVRILDWNAMLQRADKLLSILDQPSREHAGSTSDMVLPALAT